MSQDVELWTAELAAAGWTRVNATVWKSPSGLLFRGPYGAWCNMHAEPSLNEKSELVWYEDVAQRGTK